MDVGHGEDQAFIQAKNQAVEGEEEHAAAQAPGVIEDGLGLLNAEDAGQAAGLGRADEAGLLPNTCRVKNLRLYRSSLTPLQECWAFIWVK
jgi:hypothetical protein